MYICVYIYIIYIHITAVQHTPPLMYPPPEFMAVQKLPDRQERPVLREVGVGHVG